MTVLLGACNKEKDLVGGVISKILFYIDVKIVKHEQQHQPAGAILYHVIYFIVNKTQSNQPAAAWLLERADDPSLSAQPILGCGDI